MADQFKIFFQNKKVCFCYMFECFLHRCLNIMGHSYSLSAYQL